LHPTIRLCLRLGYPQWIGTSFSLFKMAIGGYSHVFPILRNHHILTFHFFSPPKNHDRAWFLLLMLTWDCTSKAAACPRRSAS
jgi:hypothetical protein